MTPKIKRLGFIGLLVIVVGGGWLLLPHSGRAGNNSTSTHEKTLYTCGMHPQVIQDHPGDCPICGMKLTPIRKQPAVGAAASTGSSVISVDPVTVQNMGIRTGTVVRGRCAAPSARWATVDFDETTLADVTTKFKGWIEKLYVDSTGKLVHKGEPLFEIYSPELYSAQTEYLLALNQTPGSPGPER